MLKNIFLVLKGFIIGVGKIVPGVSGAILAMILGLYAKGIDAIVNFFANPKKNFKFLFFVGLGIILGIVIFSKIISYFLKYNYFLTMIFFIGLISGGLPNLIKSYRKNYFLIIISFFIMTYLMLSNVSSNYSLGNGLFDVIIFLFGGILEGIGTIVPGISGTALLMILGIYNFVIEMISNFTDISLIIKYLYIIIPFVLGMTISIILLSIAMNRLLKNNKNNTYSVLTGIVFSTIFIMLFKVFSFFEFKYLFLSVILFLLGFLISNKLDD